MQRLNPSRQLLWDGGRYVTDRWDGGRYVTDRWDGGRYVIDSREPVAVELGYRCQ